jgi:hypothetical protein
MLVCSARTAAAAADGARPDHLAAIFCPGQSQGAHSGRFPGAGRGDRKLKTCPGGTHLADQRGLPNIKSSAVRRHLQQR